MDTLYRAFENFTLPTYREIPDVGLYLDQVVKYVNSWFPDFPEMNVTASMLTNYVKQKIVPRTKGKTYSRGQIADFIFIAMAKTVLSMEKIRIISGGEGAQDNETLYNAFRDRLLNVLRGFSGATVSEVSPGSGEDPLTVVCIAIGHKMYLERFFVRLQETGAADDGGILRFMPGKSILVSDVKNAQSSG